MTSTSIVHNLTKSNLKKLAVEGRTSTCVLHLETINAKPVGVYQFKTADSSEIRGVFPLADTGTTILKNGFPLTTGDAFEAIYLPSDPQVHRVELLRPTHATISNYIAMALKEEQRKKPEESKEKSLCGSISFFL